MSQGSVALAEVEFELRPRISQLEDEVEALKQIVMKLVKEKSAPHASTPNK